MLNAYSLRIKVDNPRYDEHVPKDQILAQNPVANSKLKRNSHVRVVMSLGAKKISVPNLEGQSLRAAQIVVLQRGLTLAWWQRSLRKLEKEIGSRPSALHLKWGLLNPFS